MWQTSSAPKEPLILQTCPLREICGDSLEEGVVRVTFEGYVGVRQSEVTAWGNRVEQSCGGIRGLESRGSEDGGP